jgi:hypothetical protein
VPFLLSTRSGSERCQAIYEAIQAAMAAFTEGPPQGDDITVLVLEYAE